MIISGTEEFSNSLEGFSLYETQNMSKYYNNYLECIFIYLYEDCLLEDIKQYQKLFSISDSLLEKLILLRKMLYKFYKECQNLDDFSLLKRKEWKEIVPLAEECLKRLKKMKEANKINNLE